MLVSRRALIGSAMLAAPTLTHLGAHAQAAYPDRPIRVLVPYAAGGG